MKKMTLAEVSLGSETLAPLGMKAKQCLGSGFPLLPHPGWRPLLMTPAVTVQLSFVTAEEAEGCLFFGPRTGCIFTYAGNTKPMEL